MYLIGGTFAIGLMAYTFWTGSRLTDEPSDDLTESDFLLAGHNGERLRRAISQINSNTGPATSFQQTVAAAAKPILRASVNAGREAGLISPVKDGNATIYFDGSLHGGEIQND